MNTESTNKSIISEAVLDAEKVILTNALAGGNDKFNKLVDEGVNGGTFFSGTNRVIWVAMEELVKAGGIIDLTAVVRQLEGNDTLSTAGGMARVAEIYADVSRGQYSLDIAMAMVNESKSKRSLRACALELFELAGNAAISSEEALAETEKLMSGLRDCYKVAKIPTVKDACRKVVDSLEWEMQNPGKILGLSTGFRYLDKHLDGLVGSRLIVVAARPGVGKTAFLANILAHCILRENVCCGMFSLEMPIEQIVRRIVFSEARFNPEGLRKGYALQKGEMGRIHTAVRRVMDSNFIVDDTSALSIDRLQARARRMVKEDGVKVLGVDYMGLMRGVSRQASFSREREVSEISAGLKAIAKELNVPVIALTQLNRGPENRTGGVPKMSDLRDSGSIEQDADQIIFLHRPWYFDKSADIREAKVILDKNRHGSTGIVDCVWEPEFTTYREVERTAGEAKPTVKGVLPDPEEAF